MSDVRCKQTTRTAASWQAAATEAPPAWHQQRARRRPHSSGIIDRLRLELLWVLQTRARAEAAGHGRDAGEGQDEEDVSVSLLRKTGVPQENTQGGTGMSGARDDQPGDGAAALHLPSAPADCMPGFLQEFCCAVW